MIAVGIDPDTKSTGIAAVQSYNGGFQILHVELVRAVGRLAADRRVEMAEELIKVMRLNPFGINYIPTAVAVEWMKLRPREKRPNDIVNLNGIAGMCVMAATQLKPDYIFTPIPQEWKGTVPKKIHQARILDRLHLTPELAYKKGYGNGVVPGSAGIPKSMRTHVIDALGLAVWALCPLGPVHTARISARAKK